MENDQESVQAVVGGMELRSIHVFDIPDIELKDFYLKEAFLMAPHHCTPNRSEFELLSILRREYKKLIGFLSQLNNIHWMECIHNLQTTHGFYLTQNQISQNERLKTNADFIKHLHSLTLLIENQEKTKQLFGIYTQHYVNLERLLKQFPEYTTSKSGKED